MVLTKFSRCPLLILSILVIFADFVRSSDPQVVTCNMPSVVKGQKAELTCDFGVNMQDEGQRQEIYIERLTSSGETEYIAYCIRHGYPDYKCEPLSGLTRLDFSNITRYLTVGLSSVSQEDEGDYICQVADPDWPVLKTCNFALKNPQVVTCNMPSVVKGHKAELTCDFGVNMQDEGQQQEIYIERQTSSEETEYIAYCIRHGYPDYKCEPLPGVTRLDFSNITRYLTVGLSSVSQEDEGGYICQVADPDWPAPKTCDFSLKNNPVVIIFVTLCVILVVVIVVICCYMKRLKVKRWRSWVPHSRLFRESEPLLPRRGRSTQTEDTGEKEYKSPPAQSTDSGTQITATSLPALTADKETQTTSLPKEMEDTKPQITIIQATECPQITEIIQVTETADKGTMTMDTCLTTKTTDKGTQTTDQGLPTQTSHRRPWQRPRHKDTQTTDSQLI
ncbi:uncharacterized protein LOC143291646 isoform X2 [Babylonia areolata]|uniref:uncharacterized protein LOC143291646 isoform X2 n=1 Tax=Babylonia areolata TaxID=304850 RepID=UPI003FD4C394